MEILAGWGLKPELAPHVFDRHGYLAGSDAARVADINDALRDPEVRGLFATRGGKGAYRIADALDFDAARNDPKLLVGFSEITILHLALWKHAGLVGVHGPMVSWSEDYIGQDGVDSLRQAVMSTEVINVVTDTAEPTAQLTTTGRATGVLLGGNQDSIATAAGWALPALSGAILLLEAVNLRLGHIDRQLTMLRNAGYLEGVRGVAVGQYTDCGPDAATQGEWSAIDVLHDRLAPLGVPILAGLPIGHGRHPRSVPIGTRATIDADAGTLTVPAGVR